MLPIKRQCIGDGIQTDPTSRQRSPYLRNTETRLCPSYTPVVLATDLTSRASQTQGTSHLEKVIVNTRKHEDLFLKKNHVKPNEDGELLEAAPVRLPAKDVEETSATSSSGGRNFTSNHKVTYCFGMVTLLVLNFNVGKVNRLPRYLETSPCFRSQKAPRTYCFASAVKLCCSYDSEVMAFQSFFQQRTKKLGF